MATHIERDMKKKKLKLKTSYGCHWCEDACGRPIFWTHELQSFVFCTSRCVTLWQKAYMDDALNEAYEDFETRVTGGA